MARVYGGVVLDYTSVRERRDERIDSPEFHYSPARMGTPFPDDPLTFDDGEDRKCRYCRRLMRFVSGKRSDERNPVAFFSNSISSCRRCGWWHETEYFSYCEGERLSGEERYIVTDVQRYGILREYEVASLEIPVCSLRNALLKKPQLLLDIMPYKLEELVGAVLSDHMDCEVKHVGRSRDGGIDLLLLGGDQEFVVQVKRRSRPGSGEGVSVVRDFLGAMLLREQGRGIIVSTAHHFTSDAQEAAEKARSLRIIQEIDLIDFGRFVDLLKLTCSENKMPWEFCYERRRTQGLKRTDTALGRGPAA